MKIRKYSLLLLAGIIAALGVTGCASLNAPNTESLLSAAGFQAKSPETDRQIDFYGDLDPYKLEHSVVKGHSVYTYADKKHGVVYFGGTKAYQRYKELALKQQIAEDNLSAAEMNQDAAMDWDGWGPMGGLWY